MERTIKEFGIEFFQNQREAFQAYRNASGRRNRLTALGRFIETFTLPILFGDGSIQHRRNRKQGVAGLAEPEFQL